VLRRAFCRPLLAPVLMSLSYSVTGAHTPSPTAGFSPETLALLNTARDTLLLTSPGDVIFVESPNGRYHEAMGVANVQTQAPLDPDTQFEIGSNTKVMTATIILQLVEEARLGLDDPAGITLLEGDTSKSRSGVNHYLRVT
jgi:D-alanyl-D-alanine carboxypeptidase